MSFYPLKISLANKTTGAPLTTYTQLNLRVSPYSTALYSQLSSSGGIYTFGDVGSPIVPGEYKLYDNNTELTDFGILKIGESNAVLITENQSVAGNKTFTGNTIFSGVVELNDDVTITGDVVIQSGGSLQVDNTPTDPNDVIRKSEYDVTAKLDDDNEYTMSNNFTASTVFSFDDPPECDALPTEDNHLTNKLYVTTAISGIEVTPFQESPNIIRLIPGGTQQTGQVYTTYANAMQYALASASVDRRMYIEVQGMGTAGYNYINISNAGGTYIDDYIHLIGTSQDIIMIPPATDNIGVSTLGNSIIENFTIYKDDSGVDLLFTNIIFKDIIFDLTCLSVTFNNCKFKNCEMKVNDDGDNTATFTSCKGNLIASNQSVGSSTVDANIKSKADF